MTEPRRFMQIQYTGHERYVAVADDGTAWEFIRRNYAWVQLPNLPYRKADHEQ